MCILVDVNAFPTVFDTESIDHLEFRPVLEWVCLGKGKMVFGGTKYRDELRKVTKYLRILAELKRANKIVEINDQDVDTIQADVEGIIQHSDFDDPHLIAIIRASGCLLVCSRDKRAYQFLKNSDLYPKRFKRPKIYRGKSNKKLLNDKNIADCCKPAKKEPTLSSML